MTKTEVIQLLGQCDLTTLIDLRDYALIAGYVVLGRRNLHPLTEGRIRMIVKRYARQAGLGNIRVHVR